MFRYFSMWDRKCSPLTPLRVHLGLYVNYRHFTYVGQKVRWDKLTVVPALGGEWMIQVPETQCCWSADTWRRPKNRQSTVKQDYTQYYSILVGPESWGNEKTWMSLRHPCSPAVPGATYWNNSPTKGDIWLQIDWRNLHIRLSCQTVRIHSLQIKSLTWDCLRVKTQVKWLSFFNLYSKILFRREHKSNHVLKNSSVGRMEIVRLSVG